MRKILVVEDDKEINRLIRDYLTDNGYITISAENGLDAVRIIRDESDIDLVILDLMLPFQSGDMVLQKVRGFSDIPIIIVSAKSMVQSKIDAIRMGADDYITKPFDLDELFVRIEAVLRRSQQKSSGEDKTLLTYKKLTLDRNSGTAAVDGKSLVLTGKEYAILELMLLNPKKLFSKSNLFESVWNEPYFKEDTTIKVHMSNIRSKIKKLDDTQEYIETVWGMGYKLSD
ncbi:MAG: response regulator transcription factor [Ruminococcus sp.]|jgi:DNA-binding response OmpR family regulator|nr:response regulator transcription factor [Ruminococcus sp.]